MGIACLLFSLGAMAQAGPSPAQCPEDGACPVCPFAALESQPNRVAVEPGRPASHGMDDGCSVPAGPVVLFTNDAVCVIERDSARNMTVITLMPMLEQQDEKTFAEALPGELNDTPAPSRLAFRPEDCRFDPEFAALQRAFAREMARGNLEEAERVAGNIGTTDPGVRRAAAMGNVAESGPHHRVGYREGNAPGRRFASAAPSWNWEELRSQRISFHFQGASLAEVAEFFHHASGLNVRLEGPATDQVKIYCSSRDLSVQQALRVVLGSCGHGYAIGNGEILLAPASIIAKVKQHSESALDEAWLP